METRNGNIMETGKNAALAAGAILKNCFEKNPIVSHKEAHDIKLELDKYIQNFIELFILNVFPNHAIYGEEGIRGDKNAKDEWIIDPIDGTVNFFYGIPHFAISIAHRSHGVITTGIIYDPMREELWEASRESGKVTLNGNKISVSKRDSLSETVISIGVSKTAKSREKALSELAQIMHLVRKTRTMGSATLDIAYVATGRLDAYIENQISLWDVAAGILMVELAGGKVDFHETSNNKFAIIASSGLIPYFHSL